MLLPLVVVLLPRAGYARVRSALARLVRERATLPPDVEARLQETTRMVDLAAGRLPLRPACLARSLVLWTLLGTQGIPADLRLGVRAGGAPLDAHAWVEFAGRPLNDTADHVRTYEVLSGDGGA